MTQNPHIASPLSTESRPQAPTTELGWEGLEEHRSSLRRFLLGRCSDDNDIHDIIQETFLRAARYRSEPMDEGRLRGWLIRIASNVQVDKARRTSRGPTNGLPPEMWENVGEPAEPAENIVWSGGEVVMEEALECLQVAGAQMRDHDRTVLDEFYLRRSGTEEIAGRLGVTPGMVKVRLFRARQRLRDLLERQFRLLESPRLAWA
jgi:RNA polymerase sigma-70 factor (ECF subfamily)